MNETETYCKKLVYETGESSRTVLYGIILNEDDFFITFKTRNKEYQISKKAILTIETTDRVFEEE